MGDRVIIQKLENDLQAESLKKGDGVILLNRESDDIGSVVGTYDTSKDDGKIIRLRNVTILPFLINVENSSSIRLANFIYGHNKDNVEEENSKNEHPFELDSSAFFDPSANYKIDHRYSLYLIRKKEDK